MPISLQKRAIDFAHIGHQGIVKTKQLLRSKVWFPKIDILVENAIKSCQPCQSTIQKHHQAPISSTKLPNGAFQQLDMDYAGPFTNGKYVIIVIDEFSRYPIAEITSSTSFNQLQPILQKIFAIFGIPKSIKTDNGPPFNGNDFKNYLESLNIRHVKVTPYWPQANGLAERFVKTFKRSLKCAYLETGNFVSQINNFLLNYRTTPNTTTGTPPANLVFRYEINTFLPTIHKSQTIKYKKFMTRTKENKNCMQTKPTI